MIDRRTPIFIHLWHIPWPFFEKYMYLSQFFFPICINNVPNCPLYLDIVFSSLVKDRGVLESIPISSHSLAFKVRLKDIIVHIFIINSKRLIHLSMSIEFFAHSMVAKTIGLHLFLGEDVSSIEDVGRLLHDLVELRVVVCLEGVPFCKDYYCVRIPHCLFCRFQLHDLL